MDGQTVSLCRFHVNVNSCVSMFAMALVMAFALTLLTTHALQAQTFSVIHNFTNGADGANPYAGVTVSGSGILYGTAANGGTGGGGTVFKLTPHGSNWLFSPLYSFPGGSEGASPWGGVVIGHNGALYGTTQEGGDGGVGTVFELRPGATFCRSFLCYWSETVLYAFTGTPDGAYPRYVNLAFDHAGDVYGTTSEGGMYGYGTTFELTPSGSGYSESILHNFAGNPDGESPYAGVVLDAAGNVYGTTSDGGNCDYGCGTVYQLMPSNGGWLENVLVDFGGTDGSPWGNLIIDDSGSLYGTTADGVVFKLTPSGGGFTYSQLYSGCHSIIGGVAMDAAGDLFGVCYQGGAYQEGSVFELTNCSETCTVVDLHDFSGSDGAGPWGTPVLDANGNLYGTTVIGGANCVSPGCGVVWEIAGVGAPRKN